MADVVARQLTEHYPHPDVAERICARIRQRLAHPGCRPNRRSSPATGSSAGAAAIAAMQLVAGAGALLLACGTTTAASPR